MSRTKSTLSVLGACVILATATITKAEVPCGVILSGGTSFDDGSEAFVGQAAVGTLTGAGLKMMVGALPVLRTCSSGTSPTGSFPPSGAIDAGQPTASSGAGSYGWDTLELTFAGSAPNADRWDFAVTVTGGCSAPHVTRVTPTGSQLLVELDSPISPGCWTLIEYVPESFVVKLGYQPADVGGDGTSSPADILALIDWLNGVGPSLELWAVDIDRSGVANAADILGVIDLLNGSSAFDVWNGRSLPP